MSKTINLFVSHKGEDESKIDDFKALMKNKGYEFRDSSIRESDPNNAHNEDYIKNQYLKPAINWAGTIVVLIGKHTHESDWVNWEIGYAHKSGKLIIGVFLHGESDAELPEAFNEYGDKCVGWNSDKIDQAIKTNKMFWEDEDGSQLLTNNSIYRHTC